MITVKGKLAEISSWVLVFCALLTTGIVTTREIRQNAKPLAIRKAVYVEGWQEALDIGMRWGAADAPVQVVEFADFQCPFCARFEATVRTTLDRYPTQIAFTLVHFPLPDHDFSETAARAAECASLQGAVKMRSLLFERQQGFGSVLWSGLAREAGVSNIEQFDECVNDARPLTRIEQGKKLGDRLSVKGTPTIIINGWKMPVPPSPEHFDKILKNVAAGRKPMADLDFS